MSKVIQKLKAWHKNMSHKRAIKAATAKVRKYNRAINDSTVKTGIATAKATETAAKNFAQAQKIRQRQLKIEMGSNKGGWKGKYYRGIKEAKAKSEAKIENTLQEPKLNALERQTKIETDAEVKKTRAKGVALGTVGSAVAGGYAKSEEWKAKAKIAQADADEETAKALRDSLDSVPDDVSGNPSRTGKITGMLTGVR